ncbi:MAG: hypothetical protein OXO52_17330 [Rhodospirillales bacterium]|nr:hypothetical protein [Rhodospirillales bacterium]MDE0378500.1 hypothetical protein [Rhodospirillales bacterium]
MNTIDLTKRIVCSLPGLKRCGRREAGSASCPSGIPALSGAVLAALLTWLWSAGTSWAVSLGDMAKEAAGDLETVPSLLAIAFYIIGAAIVGFGLLKLKRHVDHPQQTTIGSGLIAILIGVALIAAPAVINALGDTFGIDGGSHTVLKPRL